MARFKRRVAMAVVTAAMIGGSVAAAAVPAGAAMSCQNGGGNQPPGQQGTCTGQGLTNVNPAGHAPAGQNK